MRCTGLGVLAATIPLVTLAACTGRGTSESQAPVTARSEALPAVRRLPPPPTASVREHTVALAGDHVLLLGGRGFPPGSAPPRPDDAVYSIATNRWRKLDSPFDDPLDEPGAVWTGTRVIVVGTPCDEEYGAEDTDPYCEDRVTRAVSYAPAADRWQHLAAPPELPDTVRQPPHVEGLGWTGRYALFRAITATGSYYWLYDGRTDGWDEIARVAASRYDPLCVAGDEIFRMGTLGPDGYWSDPIVTQRYDTRARRWRR
jgi:hypothetical protein